MEDGGGVAAHKEHHLVLISIPDSFLARGMNPFYWNYLYRDLIEFLNTDELFKLTPADKIRLFLYRSLAPMTDIFINLLVAPKRVEKARRRALESE